MFQLCDKLGWVGWILFCHEGLGLSMVVRLPALGSRGQCVGNMALVLADGAFVFSS